MEWVYSVGSIASIVSLLIVLVGLARKQQRITETTFRYLALLVGLIGLIGIGVLAMYFGKGSLLEYAGGGIVAVSCLGLLYFVGTFLGYTTGSGARKGE